MTIAKHSTVSSKIRGATDGTEIGNVGDRLKVDAQVSISPVPLANTIQVPAFLQDGSTISMAVDGSVTSVVYEYEVPTGETWYLDSIGLTILDNGVMNYDKFGGSNSALTNGLLLEYEISSTSYTFFNLKTNLEVNQAFPRENSAGSSSGWLDANDYFSGRADFSSSVKLEAGDKIRATVRDNLTTIQELVISVYKWREL